MQYKDENTGWVYQVSPQPGERDLYFIEYLDPSNSVIFKRLPDYPGSKFKESAEEVLAARAQRNGWTPTAPLEIAAEGDKGCDDSMLIYHSPIGFTCQEMSEDDLICKNAPAPTGGAAATTTESAVKLLAGAEETSTTSESAEDASTLTNLSEQTAPKSGMLDIGKDIDVPTGFDYSGIEESTAAVLYNAQSIIINARKECIIKIADAVSMAHDKLVANCDNSKHSHRGENTFRAWCTSVGIGKDAAYRLLQVSTLLKNSTESELQVLEQVSPSLLYAAAKPSAPAKLVQAVKDGEITTHKQYKELEAQLKETQERAERAEREAQEAKEKAHRLETRELYDANQRIKELENRPIEVATQPPTEEQINAAAEPVIQEMTAMYKIQQEQQREQIRELKAIVAASRNAIPNACRAIAESCAEAFARGFEEFQAMAQDLSDDEYMNAVEPIFEACREIIDSLEGADYVEG